MRFGALPVVAAALLCAAGCASFYPVETTPEAITGTIQPGDTVRVRTRDREELVLLVTAINDYRLRGRVDGNPQDVRSLGFDGIERLEIERLNMRRALLTVVLPVVAGAIIACNNGDCRTDSVLDARF
ncbi:MAG TPA: hypothetical protein VF329_06495 [Gammaproteobacteria bacterium]